MGRKSHDKRQSSARSRGPNRLIDHRLMTFVHTIENAQGQVEGPLLPRQILKLVETDWHHFSRTAHQ
jgi:phage FluMu protein gp41